MFIVAAVVIILLAAGGKYLRLRKDTIRQQEKEKLEKSLIFLKKTIDQTLEECKKSPLHPILHIR